MSVGQTYMEKIENDTIGDKNTELTELCIDLLKIDFEKAYVVHQDYKDEQTKLLQFSVKLLAFPVVVVSALLTAKIVSDLTTISELFELEVVWISFIISGILNVPVARAHIMTDIVQTESKHQVNRIRGLYLHILKPVLPDNWEPFWGDFNDQLDAEFKAKSANISSIILTLANATYVGFGGFKIVSNSNPNYDFILIIFFIFISTALFLFQQQYFISLINRKIIKS